MLTRRLGLSGWIGAFWLSAVVAAPPLVAEPLPKEGSLFIKKETWLETVIASREALARQEVDVEGDRQLDGPPDPSAKGFKSLFVEMTGKDKPRKVRFQVAGLKRIYLATKGAKGFFADLEVVDLLGDAKPIQVGTAPRAGWFARRQEDPYQRDDKVFGRILHSQDSETRIEIKGDPEWLEMWIGASSQRESRPVQIMVDARPVLERGKKRAKALETIWQLAADAFGPPALRQQHLEEEAGIWSGDWKPGDMAELALRYAKACDPSLRQEAVRRAKQSSTIADLEAVRGLFYVRYARARLDQARKTLELVERSAPRPEMGAELAALEKQLLDAEQGRVSGATLYSLSTELRRRIILSHPALDFPKLVINKRTSFLPEHMCDQYLGRHSQAGPGLVVLDHWKERPEETPLLQGKLPKGGTIHPDLSYDGQRLLFAFADHESPRQGQLRGYFIYEYSLETGQARQVTGTEKDPLLGRNARATVLIEDMDPCYLPDGGFAFISTRSQQYGRCHGGRYVPSYTLYRGELDGSRIRPLSFNEANEWSPSVLNDGILVYCRWDYINRHDTIFQSLWSMRPDGTQTAHYYGNNSPAPCLTGEPQAIPGSHKTVFTAAAHHGQMMGTICVVDPHKGQEHGGPLTWITPELGFPESSIPPGITRTELPLPEDVADLGLGADVARRPQRRAATPWPVTEDIFLCAYPHGNMHAVYLVDSAGGRELIHADANVSCFDPIPLRPRPMPRCLPPAYANQPEQKTGVFYVQDVYRATYPVERGTVRSMRVNQILSQPTSSAPVRSHAANEIVKKILGTVPVAEDGSVAFEAPAEVPLQFQLLDASGMAVMTMRSTVYLQPGERASCVGCHEPRNSSPPPAPLAKVKIHTITPSPGPAYEGGFSFARTVQPVLDRYCIACHGLEKTEGAVDLTGSFALPGDQAKSAQRRSAAFSVAYESLVRVSGLVKVAPRNGETHYSRPMDYFAHAGRLAKMLLDGHPDKQGKKRVHLDRDAFQRIVDWMDVNAQFYGDYSFNRIETQPPSAEGEKALRAAIRQRFGSELAAQPLAALVNAAHPDESRILRAPLPEAAGGWEQIAQNPFTGTDDPGWQAMRTLVAACVTPLKYHDIAGTCAQDACRCGNCWVRKDRQARQPAALASGKLAGSDD